MAGILRNKTTGQLHQNLCQRFSWYSRWHKYPRHGHVHAFVFFIFFAGMISGVIFQLHFISPTFAAAGINKQIQYEGKLTDAGGTAVADGAYSIVFSLYTVSSGGSAAWTETQSVTVSNGYFAVMLGSSTSLSSITFSDDTYYLGVKVGSDAEMTPRKRIGAAAYAFNADSLGGTDASSFSTLTGSQTLTNKTITSPVISTISNTGTLTLPTATDTLVGRATTDTLTNKTLTSPVIATITNAGDGIILQGPGINFQTSTAIDDALTIAPKTGGVARFYGVITSTDLTAGRTYTLPNSTGSVPLSTDGNELFFITTGGASNTITLPASGTLASLAGTETLTNKTLQGTSITFNTATATDDQIKITPFAGGAAARFSGTITSTDLTADKTWNFPNVDGQITVQGNTTTGTGSIVLGTSPGFTTAANPVSSDGAALGTSSLLWSDLFLASGSVINFNADVTITHSSNTLAFAGASSGYTFDANTMINFPDNGTGMNVTTPSSQANLGGNTFINFNSGGGAEGSITGADGGVLTYATFTGSHWTTIADKRGLEAGMVLCSTGEQAIFGKETAPKDQLVTSRICDKKADTAAWGVYGGNDEKGHDLVLALGTGMIWVKNTGHDVAIGAYLTSSLDRGLAEVQSDDLLHNYTVAKTLESIKWKKGETKRKIAVTYHGG
ncbi:MAG: hypothetical protein Q7S16_03850 [bacterium]|nr:hypothetical protein [bacterium]